MPDTLIALSPLPSPSWEPLPQTESRSQSQPKPFTPSRLSSEAPEVVPDQLQPPHLFSPFPSPTANGYSEHDLKRGTSQKQVDDRRTTDIEVESYPLSPDLLGAHTPGGGHTSPTTPRSFLSIAKMRIGNAVDITPVSYSKYLDKCDSDHVRRSPGRRFGLGMTIALVVVAFLLGGGIGGAVGGALVAQEKTKYASIACLDSVLKSCKTIFGLTRSQNRCSITNDNIPLRPVNNNPRPSRLPPGKQQHLHISLLSCLLFYHIPQTL